MIVKIHSRGAGSGSGPVDYLLGKDRNREQAEVLRGDPERVKELIDTSEYTRTYTSGVLSFQERDLPADEKTRLMDEWENTLMTGLDKDQYTCLWVQHQDKGRLELNFVIPNVELQSGKRLQPYFDRADRPRVNAWQTLTNERLGLRDPNDPIYRRPLTPASDLPRDKQLAAESITKGLTELMRVGQIRERKDVVSHLEQFGFQVVRETKNSLSIADPSGGRNIRLKGAIYERDFKFGEGLRGEIEAAGAGYRAEREARVREAGEVYQRGTAIKLAEHQQRYPRAERQVDGHAQNVSLNGDGVDIHLLRPADWHPGRDNLVSRHDHHLTPERNGQLQSAAGEPESEKRRGRDDLQRRKEPEHLPGGAAEAGARRGNLHLAGREYRGEIHGEITSSERPESRLSGFNTEDEQNHDRDGKTASERLRELTGKLRATAGGVAGQLQQFAAHVRGYLTGADAQRQGVSALEQSGRELARAGRELEQERQPLDALIAQHDRARAEKLREQQPEPQKKPTRYYGPSM